jgi:hypothetical protein
VEDAGQSSPNEAHGKALDHGTTNTRKELIERSLFLTVKPVDNGPIFSSASAVANKNIAEDPWTTLRRKPKTRRTFGRIARQSRLETTAD